MSQILSVLEKTMTLLSPALRLFLEQPHFAVVATIGRDGLPHQTVVWYMLEGDQIVFSFPRDTVKHKHLLRDPRLSICIEQGFSYVTIVGTATLEEDPQAARAQYAHVGDRYRVAMSAPMPARPPSAKSMELMSRERVAVRVTIDKLISQGVE
jgi:PPOX class probable F420-dependent enzyme